MTNGYQIVEPKALARLLGRPSTFEPLIVLLTWLAEECAKELGERLDGAELAVIRVTYHGSYPALGIRYPRSDSEDLGAALETTIEKILMMRTASDIVAFLESSTVDWAHERGRLLP